MSNSDLNESNLGDPDTGVAEKIGLVPAKETMEDPATASARSDGLQSSSLGLAEQNQWRLRARIAYEETVADGLHEEEPLSRARINAHYLQGEFEQLTANDGATELYGDIARAERGYEDALAIPHGVRSRRQEWLPNPVKLLLVIGDATLIGMIWWRAGQLLWLSLLAGLSTGIVAVVTGAMVGKEGQLSAQRERRGRRPASLPRSTVHLFSEGRGGTPWWWIGIAGLVSLAVMTGLTLIGRSVGDPTGLTFSAGLLGALTLIGSGAVEAYGTNEAADLVTRRATELAEARSHVQHVVELNARRASAWERVSVLEQQLERTAIAAAHRELASDRRLRNPERWGDATSPGAPLPPGAGIYPLPFPPANLVLRPASEVEIGNGGPANFGSDADDAPSASGPQQTDGDHAA